MNFGRHLERASLFIEKVAAVFLAAITVLIVVSAIGRYVFAYPIPDAFDLSRLLLGATIMWGFASVGFRGSHIKVDLFVEMMPRRLARLVDLFAWLVLFGFTMLLAWMMLKRVLSAEASGEATFDLRLPAWPFLGLIWLGVVFSLVTIAARIGLLASGRGGLEGFEEIDAERAAVEKRHGDV